MSFASPGERLRHPEELYPNNPEADESTRLYQAVLPVIDAERSLVRALEDYLETTNPALTQDKVRKGAMEIFHHADQLARRLLTNQD